MVLVLGWMRQMRMICDRQPVQVGSGRTRVGSACKHVDDAMPKINVRCVKGVTCLGRVAEVAGGVSGGPHQDLFKYVGLARDGQGVRWH